MYFTKPTPSESETHLGKIAFNLRQRSSFNSMEMLTVSHKKTGRKTDWVREGCLLTRDQLKRSGEGKNQEIIPASAC
jgi:hypothetical protein